MASLRKKQRTKLIAVGMVFLFAATGLVIYALGDGVSPWGHGQRGLA